MVPLCLLLARCVSAFPHLLRFFFPSYRRHGGSGRHSGRSDQPRPAQTQAQRRPPGAPPRERHRAGGPHLGPRGGDGTGPRDQTRPSARQRRGEPRRPQVRTSPPSPRVWQPGKPTYLATMTLLFSQFRDPEKNRIWQPSSSLRPCYPENCVTSGDP